LAPGKGGMYGTTSDSEPAAGAPDASGPAEFSPVETQPASAKQPATQKIKRCFVIAGGV